MRRLLSCLALLAVVLPSASCFALNLQGHHSTNIGYANSGELCKPCHIPHHAFNDGTLVDKNGNPARFAPLWNHGVDTITNFTIYTSPSGTFDATWTNGGQPTGNSILCLSCHDGVIARDQFGYENAGTWTMQDTANTGTKFTSTSIKFIGTDLRLSHPFSFTYDSALATTHKGLKDPSTTTVTLDPDIRTYGGTIATDLLFPRGGSGGTNLECCSCHEIHGTSGTREPLLIIDNAGSALCLTCHN